MQVVRKEISATCVDARVTGKEQDENVCTKYNLPDLPRSRAVVRLLRVGILRTDQGLQGTACKCLVLADVSDDPGGNILLGSSGTLHLVDTMFLEGCTDLKPLSEGRGQRCCLY